MSNEKTKIYLGTLKECTSRDGKTFFAGKLGFNGLLVFQSKDDPAKWNMFVTEQETKEEREERQRNSGGSQRQQGGWNNRNGGGVPF